LDHSLCDGGASLLLRERCVNGADDALRIESQLDVAVEFARNFTLNQAGAKTAA
jgi:hypothetical protein